MISKPMGAMVAVSLHLFCILFGVCHSVEELSAILYLYPSFLAILSLSSIRTAVNNNIFLFPALHTLTSRLVPCISPNNTKLNLKTQALSFLCTVIASVDNTLSHQPRQSNCVLGDWQLITEFTYPSCNLLFKDLKWHILFH